MSWFENKWHDEVGLDKGKSLSLRLKKIESNLNISNNNEKASDDLTLAKYKADTLAKQSSSPKVKEAYNEVIKKHLQLLDRQFQSKLEYIDATKNLIIDLWNIQTNDWRLLKNTTIDWWLYDSIVNVYEWTKKATEKIVKEFEETLKLIVTPEEWNKILQALTQVLTHPIDFVDNLIRITKTEAKEVYDYISIVQKSSTNVWFTTEMSKYLPEVWIPVILSTVWPWKFFKLLKLDKFLPEKLLVKLGKVEKVVAEEKSVLPDMGGVNKCTWKTISEVNYILDWQILLIKNTESNLSAVVRNIDKVDKVDTYTLRELNKKWNEFIRARLTNLENFVEFAEEKGSIKMRDKIIDEALLPLKREIKTLKKGWKFMDSDENAFKMIAIIKRLNLIK